ncbi:helix-turn-helix domain-containing protein [Streptomyces sp. NRRL B-24484]|uniref:helix-turn-helix domain-containing protein n=1 Tax=Streptomyces sp. NRRL B-24484 TaxID=1463833 RepID=UPI0006948CB0|nr:helix-turn-helix transcriptional regulator [Streptomyces sp. NRRL B-24484]
MNTTTEGLLRLSVAALMRATGEQQRDLAAGLGLSQSQVSRKQSGMSSWSLDDLDRLAAHYGVPVLDLLSGPTEAVRRLPAARLTAALGGTQSVIAV